MSDATTLQLLGAGGFGALIGWYIYYINRYRKDAVQLGDLVTLIGAIGGGAVLTLFPEQTDLFGAYGVGLFAGFFGYFLLLVLLVLRSHGEFTATWFLDGRRRRADPPTRSAGRSRAAQCGPAATTIGCERWLSPRAFRAIPSVFEEALAAAGLPFELQTDRDPLRYVVHVLQAAPAEPLGVELVFRPLGAGRLLWRLLRRRGVSATRVEWDRREPGSAHGHGGLRPLARPLRGVARAPLVGVARSVGVGARAHPAGGRREAATRANVVAGAAEMPVVFRAQEMGRYVREELAPGGEYVPYRIMAPPPPAPAGDTGEWAIPGDAPPGPEAPPADRAGASARAVPVPGPLEPPPAGPSLDAGRAGASVPAAGPGAAAGAGAGPEPPLAPSPATGRAGAAARAGPDVPQPPAPCRRLAAGDASP